MGITLELATGKKAKKQKPERLTISSPITKVVKEGQKKATKVPVVDVAIALKQQIENLEGELKNYRSQIISETSAKRDEELAAKNFVKTVDVEGTNAKIQVQFQDRYSKLDASMETPLRDIFDDKFEQMFKVDTKETLKKSKMAELKEILGDRFENFFDSETTVAPESNFQYQYFLLEDSLDDDQKETVEKVFEGCQSTPAVKFPK